jgi:hypothetical protein
LYFTGVADWENQTGAIWCKEAADWDALTGIGAWGDDLSDPNSLSELPAQIRDEAGACTSLNAPVAIFNTAGRTSCVAPCAIFFDARGTTDADLTDSETLLDLTYIWNFDDPNAGEWEKGAQNTDPNNRHSKNADTGFVAGHVYETAGTYNPVLTVFDGTYYDTDTTEITVTDPNDAWPTTSTICVSNDTDHTGCPSGATEVSNITGAGSFNTAINTSCNIDEAAVRCLLKRGDSFPASGTATLYDTGPLMLGAYGSGAKPYVTGGTYALIDIRAGQDIRIVDLALDGNDLQGSDGIYGTTSGTAVDRILILRVDMTDMDYALAFGCKCDCDAGPCTEGTNNNDEVAIIDSSSTSGWGDPAGGYDIFAVLERSMIMGNRFEERVTQHNVRLGFQDGVVTAHNDIGNGCCSSCHAIKIHNGGWWAAKDPNGTSPEFPAKDFIIADNRIQSCPTNTLDFDLGVNSDRNEELVRYWIVERNLFRLDTDVSEPGKRGRNMFRPSCGPGVVRNNVFDLTNAQSVSEDPNRLDPTGVQLRTKSGGCSAGPSGPSEGADDIRVYSNTFYNGNSGNAGWAINIASSIQDTQVQNNLCYFPGGTTDCIDDEAAGTAFCDSDPNSGDGDCNITITDPNDNPFVGSISAPSIWTEFELDSGDTLAKNKGDRLASEVFHDIGLMSRYDLSGNPVSTEPDVGVWEQGASATTTTTTVTTTTAAPTTTTLPTSVPNLGPGSIIGPGGVLGSEAEEDDLDFRMIEPTTTEAGLPLQNLRDCTAEITDTTGICEVRVIPASAPTGGGEHVLDLVGKLGSTDIEAYCANTRSQKSKSAYLTRDIGPPEPPTRNLSIGSGASIGSM